MAIFGRTIVLVFHHISSPLTNRQVKVTVCKDDIVKISISESQPFAAQKRLRFEIVLVEIENFHYRHQFRNSTSTRPYQQQVVIKQELNSELWSRANNLSRNAEINRTLTARLAKFDDTGNQLYQLHKLFMWMIRIRHCETAISLHDFWFCVCA